VSSALVTRVSNRRPPASSCVVAAMRRVVSAALDTSDLSQTASWRVTEPRVASISRSRSTATSERPAIESSGRMPTAK
jgi:hypothetical protein